MRPLAFALAAVLASSHLAAADDPTHIYPAGQSPPDARLGKPKTLDDYFPFTPPATRTAWATRWQQVREQILVATGLWPLPEKTPLNAVVHGKVERDGYTIEKVFFQSMPGHTVTGNLYRPSAPGIARTRPAVLFAHGHWTNGRFHDAGVKAAEASVKTHAEADLDRGRFFIQAIPVQLARMGCVVFQYDMVGYADSTAIVHREGFKDAQAELRLQSQMGLQTWNSIRSLDFVTSLPDVDATRVGMTGASGGGTQTFILAAIDGRLAAAFPAVMVTTGMQGGCVCENCSLLRVGTGNVEIAGLFAPKPLAMSAANDWTKNLAEKGFPDLKRLYELLGAGDCVAMKAWLEFPHNYNQPAREFMYAWFNKYLLDRTGPVTEQPYTPTPPKDLSVFDAAHPRPAGELNAAQLREAMTKASDAQLAKLMPTDAASLAEFRRVFGTAVRVMVNDALPDKVAVRQRPLESTPEPGVTLHRAVLGRVGEQDAVPCAGVYKGERPGDRFVVWVHPKGKASLFEDGKLAPAVRTLVDAGFAVLAPDTLGTGELTPPKPFAVDKNYAAFTYGYNRTLLANRVRDVLTAVTFARTIGEAKTVHVVGWGECGPVAMLAKAIAGDAVGKTAADLNHTSFERTTATDDPLVLPGAVKYQLLGTALGLCAPGEVFAYNHRGTGTGRWSKAAYASAGAAEKLKREEGAVEPANVVEWLVK